MPTTSGRYVPASFRRKERNHASHGKVLPDDAAGSSGKRGPVGAELKFQGNPGDHADGEVDSEDSPPKSGRAIVVFVIGAQRFRFQIDEQQRQTHCQLRENVVKRDCEGEVKSVHSEGLFHLNYLVTAEHEADLKLVRLNSPMNQSYQFCHLSCRSILSRYCS